MGQFYRVRGKKPRVSKGYLWQSNCHVGTIERKECINVGALNVSPDYSDEWITFLSLSNILHSNTIFY